jgi:hypothetical protein
MHHVGVCLLLLLPYYSSAVMARTSLRARANPVRKVVNLLQKMQRKVEKEAEEEKELFDKFMC